MTRHSTALLPPETVRVPESVKVWYLKPPDVTSVPPVTVVPNRNELRKKTVMPYALVPMM
jgi:hypothetical protein